MAKKMQDRIKSDVSKMAREMQESDLPNRHAFIVRTKAGTLLRRERAFDIRAEERIVAEVYHDGINFYEEGGKRLMIKDGKRVTKPSLTQRDLLQLREAQIDLREKLKEGKIAVAHPFGWHESESQKTEGARNYFYRLNSIIDAILAKNEGRF